MKKIEVQNSKIQCKYINIPCKIISVNSELRNKRNINFDNNASQILKTRPLNIVLLQKN